jgi:hypothetical protein
MAQNELRNEELGRHEEVVGRNVEKNQNLNLNEKVHGINTADQNSNIARVVYIVYFVAGALILLLGVRMLLHLLGVNPENGFANFVDTLSYLFVLPFATLLQNPGAGGMVLEVTTGIAMIVYAILAWLVGQAIWLVMSRTR